MVESFSIAEEKFIDEVYFVNLGVSFNKKKVFEYLEKNNIFPSVPLKKELLFIPIIIDEKKRDLLIFSKNKIFNEWNKVDKSFHLIKYILPTEDLEDLNFIKKKYDFIEEYDFKEISDKYLLDDFIIALIFKNEKEVRILSRISINDNVILKNQSFSNIDINDENNIIKIIEDLKINYEDYWKNLNQINTSIKLPLNIKINSSNNKNISKLEKILNETDLIYDFFISKFNKEFIYYNIIFNSTPDNFLKLMAENDSTISAMIALEVDDEVLISRLLERGKTSGRVDDSNKDIIQNRISEYYKKTAILKNFYLKKNRYFGVNGEGSIKIITERLSNVIESL